MKIQKGIENKIKNIWRFFMAKNYVGVFANADEAEAAIENFQMAGLDSKNISIVVKNESVAERLKNTGANVTAGAVSGATTGGAIGLLAGLLVGVGVLTLPGVGALMIGGPLATALGLTGAAATAVQGGVTGALAGGLVGALTGLGMSQAEAKQYEDRLRDGAVLIAVPDNGNGDEITKVFQTYGAEEVRVLNF
jgi:hypothetical protein